MPLLTILGVARGSSGCPTNGSPDQGASTGVAVPNIIADDCASYSAQGSPGKGASLSVRASGTTCEDERNSGGKTGEKLGFLPGDLKEKIDPYLRPMYDALNSIMGSSLLNKFIEQNVIEVAPLAYMRGRTLNNSFIILDEAQNSTKEQMKMFLTRLGRESKAVITGDITQIDLPNAFSGLVHVLPLLKEIPGISICKFTEEDVMRHPIVKKIINAYEKKSS